MYKRILPLATAATTAFALAACGVGISAHEKDSASGPIKVGALLSSSGIFESLGKPERNGLELAFDEINKAGGVLGRQVELVAYDDEGDQAKASQLTRRLIDSDGVDVIFGPAVTPVGEVISPQIEKAGVLNIGFIMQSYLWEHTKYVFMTMPSEEILAQSMLQDAADGVKATKIAIGYADVPFGVNGNKYLQKLAGDNGLDIVATQKWGEQDLDFSNQVRAFEAASPDAILLWGSCAPADAQLIKAIRGAGVKVPIIGNICIPSPQTVEIVGADAEGLRSFSLIDYGAPDEKTKNFIDAYTKRFGNTPEPNAVPGYDAAYAWAAAVEKAGKTDSDSVAKAMLGLSYNGVAGKFNFSEENHNGLSPAAYKLTVVKNGEWVGVAG